MGTGSGSRLSPSRGTIAVPTAKNSITCEPQPCERSCSCTPTIPSALELLRFLLHPLHRELASVVERLGEVRHLDVLAHLTHRGHHPLVGDVVDARAHHEADRPMARGEQRPEVLTGEVARERPPVRGAMQLAVVVLDRGADRDELGEMLPPFVPSDVEPDADDAVRAELVGFFFHARHRELARLVHRLREDSHLHRLLPARLLVADVVDRAADDEAERVEAGLLDEQELVHREIGGEEAALHLGEALPAVLGHSFGRGRVVAHRVPPRRCGGCVSLLRSSRGATASSRPSLVRGPIAVPRT